MLTTSLLSTGMRAFKHVEPEFADRFRTGESIQLGTLEYFRTREGLRADKAEGMAANLIETFETDPMRPLGLREREVLSGMGVHIMGNVRNVRIQNVTSLGASPIAYVFCASGKPDANLRVQGQRIFKIMALHTFAKRLVRSSGGRLGVFRARRVTYRRQVSNALTDGLVDADPFVKNPAFEWEDEIRICFQVLPMDDAVLAPTLLINCPDVAELIREV